MTDASKYYKIEGDKLTRTHRTCPKCGVGFFLADHYDRWSCGRCGYTIFKRKGKKGTASRATRRSPRKRTKSM
jgi:small subunit ribosomal protein S27Ae